MARWSTVPAHRVSARTSRSPATASPQSAKSTKARRRVIDASDLIVSPGFVDPHTHYDAQICWDPLLSCTSWHGITSVVMGNCGVGVAPCKPESREIAAWDLTNVEAIPYDSLNKGMTWDWETFPQFLDAAQKRGAAINLGFLAPLTPFRHYVMGKESMDRAATPEETAKDRGAAQRGDGRRGDRLLDHHAQAAYRLQGPAARAAGSRAGTSLRHTPTCSSRRARARLKSR